jgi:hypothetical protein
MKSSEADPLKRVSSESKSVFWCIGLLVTRNNCMRYFLILLFFLPSFLSAQKSFDASKYFQEKFDYSSTDTVRISGEIEAIRYLQPKNNLEFFVRSTYNPDEVETGYRKNGIYVSKWKRYNGDGEVIKSLDFDTLVVQADSIVKVAQVNAYDLDTYEIDFLFDEMWPGDSLEFNWVIAAEFRDVNYVEIRGISVNAMTGKKSAYGYSIHEQPVLSVPD